MPNQSGPSPILHAIAYASGFAAYCAIQKINQKRRVSRFRKERIQTLGEWISTAADIRSLPEVLED